MFSRLDQVKVMLDRLSLLRAPNLSRLTNLLQSLWPKITSEFLEAFSLIGIPSAPTNPVTQPPRAVPNLSRMVILRKDMLLKAKMRAIMRRLKRRRDPARAGQEKTDYQTRREREFRRGS
jgi:hypothetical protein